MTNRQLHNLKKKWLIEGYKLAKKELLRESWDDNYVIFRPNIREYSDFDIGTFFMLDGYPEFGIVTNVVTDEDDNIESFECIKCYLEEGTDDKVDEDYSGEIEEYDANDIGATLVVFKYPEKDLEKPIYKYLIKQLKSRR